MSMSKSCMKTFCKTFMFSKLTILVLSIILAPFTHFSKELKENFLYKGKFFEKTFPYKGNILWFFFLYKGKCCIFAPRLT